MNGRGTREDEEGQDEGWCCERRRGSGLRCTKEAMRKEMKGSNTREEAKEKTYVEKHKVSKKEEAKEGECRSGGNEVR